MEVCSDSQEETKCEGCNCEYPVIPLKLYTFLFSCKVAGVNTGDEYRNTVCETEEIFPHYVFELYACKQPEEYYCKSKDSFVRCKIKDFVVEREEDVEGHYSGNKPEEAVHAVHIEVPSGDISDELTDRPVLEYRTPDGDYKKRKKYTFKTVVIKASHTGFDNREGQPYS